MKKALLVVLSVLLVMSMTVVVFADDFISSAELQEVPEIVVDEEKPEVGAVITDANDEDTDVYVEHITITSISQAAANRDDDVSRKLISAYNEVKEYTDVVAEISGMEDELKDIGYDEYKVSVSSMFDVTLDAEYEAKLAEEGSYIVIEFTNEIGAVQDKLLVAYMVEDEWVLVANELVTVTDDTITVQFDSLCPIMFMTIEGEPAQAANNAWIFIVIAVVVVAAVAVAVYFILKKKKTNA